MNSIFPSRMRYWRFRRMLLIFAIGSGILLKKLVFQGEPAAFVLELPPYRLPTSKISPSTCGRR